MKNRLIAAILVALSLGVVNTEGVDPQAPPASLPIGSAEEFRSWIVTNRRVHVECALYFVNKSGVPDAQGTFGWTAFSSYAVYQRYIASNSLSILNQCKERIDPSIPIDAVYWVSYYLPDIKPIGVVDALNIDTSVGLASAVTSNSFVNLPVRIERAYINIPNLKKFTVEVKGLHTYSWPPGTGVSPKFIPPPEFTTTNYVVLNPWYSFGTNDATFSITVGNITRRYNRFGEAFDQPPIVKLNGSNLTASFARWANITVESSSNFTSWNVVTNWNDVVGTGSFSMPINRNKPMEFFRVGAH